MSGPITNASQLSDAVWALKDGDTLQLVGDFPATRAKRNPLLASAAAVTLDCAAATFSGQQYWTGLDPCNITFKGGTFHSGGGLRIAGYGQLAVSGASFDGGGIMADHGGAVSVTNNKFANSGCGMSVASAKHVTITDNTFTAMIGDCINLPGCQAVYVARNRCEGGNPAVGAHPDFLQTWGVTGSGAMDGWLIEDNYVKGPTQGLFLPDGVIGMARRNHLETGFANAIAVGSGTVLELEDNTILTLAGAKDQARIAEYPGGSVHYIVGNSVNGQPIGPQRSPAPPVVDPKDAAIAALQAKIAAGLKALSA